MGLPTAFTVPDAVDIWDAEFRWRDAGDLRDLTIDDTWRRVADRAASAEGLQAASWSHRFVDTFSRWRLLPGENILHAFGTDKSMPPLAEPGAVLNVAAFVIRQPHAGAWFDRERFVAVASLAVRFLDDVASAIGVESPPRRLRIGLIGLADALQGLDLDYGSSCARQQSALVARALAEGCLGGSVDLAAERGSRVSPEECLGRVGCMRRRQVPEWLIERALRIGMRHDALTAIDPHPSLARLANGVADAVGPLPSMAGTRKPGGRPTSAAELAMRAELQLWIDAPISYALNAPSPGNDPSTARAAQAAPDAATITDRQRS